MHSLYYCALLRVPKGIWLSLNTVFIFYCSILKLVTKELSSLVIHDLYWPWIPDQPRSFYQLRDHHQFIVAVLRNSKPPGDGVYHCNGFILQGPIRSTHSLFRSASSAILVVILPFFFWPFVQWHTSHLVTSFWTDDLMPGQ